jgi:hypothetical protein
VQIISIPTVGVTTSLLSPEDEDTAPMIIALRFNISIGHQKHGKDDNDNIPSWEDQPAEGHQFRVQFKLRTNLSYVKVSATLPILAGAYQAENATMAGI